MDDARTRKDGSAVRAGTLRGLGSGFRWLQVLVVVVAALAVWLAARRWTSPDGPAVTSGSLAVADVLGGLSDAGYARADRVRPFTFPADYGSHPEYRSEWWYYTGNVATAEGRRFGFQVTIFRQALTPDAEPRASAWAADQVWMGHFAVTDVAAERFHDFERFARGAAGLAGARAEPLVVWLEDWRIEQLDRPGFVVRLALAAEGVAIDLELSPEREIVLRGDGGLSQKGPEPGNASYYYAITRHATRGTVTVDGREHAVEGRTWLDREWSTSALSEGVAGWDWFALLLEDGRDVMVYQLRREDGTTAPFSAGAVVEPDGRQVHFAVDASTIEVLDTWTSPRGGVAYPARWRLRVPAADLDLEVVPRVADQEWSRASVRYWEGTAAVDGTSNGAAVGGEGYVELTGYADAPRGPRRE